MSATRVRAAAAALLLAGSVGAGLLAAPGGVAAGGGGGPPNLIVVMTDDQTIAQMGSRTMPHTTRILGDHGATFSEALTQALCCPSRAGLITGQYPHNNGVVNNHPGYRDLVEKFNTLPVWLRQAGYRTGMVGKFLNGYVESRGLTPAPGFSYWFNLLDTNYYGASISDNGTQIQLGRSGARNYVDNALTRHAVRFLRKGRRRKPFFLWISYLAPHDGNGPHRGGCPRSDPVPAPSDVGRFSHQPLPKPPSFNERNVSDKPKFIRDLDRISDKQKAAMTVHFRCALASLGAADRGVRRLKTVLQQTGRLSNTVLVLTSDNGLFYGQHRIRRGKGLPYEEGARVPLLIRLPKRLRAGARAGRTIDKPVENVDLAPTLLRLAGAEPCRHPGECRVMDGRSLMPLLRGHGGHWPDDRGMLLELAQQSKQRDLPCEFQAIRTPARTYAEYPLVRNRTGGRCVASNEAELYDLDDDRFQLLNLVAGNPPPRIDAERIQLRHRLNALRDCAGIAGRDPLPPSGHYCE
jgi:arylsulfatase A-like enzyme